MIPNAMSLKAKIKNLAKQTGVAPQALLQVFFFERFLERLSRSEYRDKFVVKGGVLISAMVGVAQRSTMDLDTTIRNLHMSPDSIQKAVANICAAHADDGIIFEAGSVVAIRAEDPYGGFRASLTAHFGVIEQPMTMDVTTGDAITPGPVRFFILGMLDGEEIPVWAYNIETILAEKAESILARNITSTRPRDFYDVYILSALNSYDTTVFQAALAATAAHRGSTSAIGDTAVLISRIAESPELQAQWARYQKQFPYAAGIRYEDTVKALSRLLSA